MQEEKNTLTSTVLFQGAAEIATSADRFIYVYLLSGRILVLPNPDYKAGA